MEKYVFSLTVINQEIPSSDKYAQVVETTNIQIGKDRIAWLILVRKFFKFWMFLENVTLVNSTLTLMIKI